MYHSINAGRLRDYIEIFSVDTEPDQYGQVGERTLVFDARAEVKTVSGSKIQQYGTTTTSTIVTVLMWFDERVENNMVLVFNGVEYTVDHVNPDTANKAMIITCEVIRK